MKILYLTLYRKYFDEIADGKKKIEYREVTPYWIARLLNKKFDAVHFRNGYNKDSPAMLVECQGIITGDHDGKKCFFIILGRVHWVKY